MPMRLALHGDAAHACKTHASTGMFPTVSAVKPASLASTSVLLMGAVAPDSPFLDALHSQLLALLVVRGISMPAIVSALPPAALQVTDMYAQLQEQIYSQVDGHAMEHVMAEVAPTMHQ
eukprot:319857-Chlamydomonas_euryale.AAC.1